MNHALPSESYIARHSLRLGKLCLELFILAFKICELYLLIPEHKQEVVFGQFSNFNHFF